MDFLSSKDLFSLWKECCENIIPDKWVPLSITIKNNEVRTGVFWEPIAKAKQYCISVFRVPTHLIDTCFDGSFSYIQDPNNADGLEVLENGDLRVLDEEFGFPPGPFLINNEIYLSYPDEDHTLLPTPYWIILPLFSDFAKPNTNYYTFDYFPDMLYIVFVVCETEDNRLIPYRPYLYDTRAK